MFKFIYILLWVCILVAPARAQWVQRRTGHGVSHPTYINLYWSTQWDSVATGGEKQSVLNDFTQALVNSDYFDSSDSDYGVGRASFAGGFASATYTGAFNTARNCGDAPPFVHFTDIANFIHCQRSHAGLPNVRHAIYNVFLPPGSIADWANLHYPGGSIDVEGCGSRTWTAYHYETPAGVPFTVEPTNTTCNASFPAVTSALSHEMIEAATDPHPPTGWLHQYGALGVDLMSELTKGEVSDVCTVEPHKADELDFLNGKLAPYWSNGARACVPPIGAIPHIDKVALEGTGQDLRITISGTHFGSLGPGFETPHLGRTPYFQISNLTSARAFSAGNSVIAGGDSIGLKYETWDDDRIVITGFIDGAADIALGDSIKISVANPQSGRKYLFFGSRPLPAHVRFSLPSTPGFVTNRAISIRIKVVDAHGEGIGIPVTVNLSLVAGVCAGLPLQLAAPPLGRYTQFAVTPIQSGLIQIRAALPDFPSISDVRDVPVVPMVTSAEPAYGRESGGSMIHLTGGNLFGITGVTFGAAAASNVIVVSDTKVYVTTPPGTGTVNVTASAPGNLFSETEVAFTYFKPRVPLLEARTNLVDCLYTIVDARVFDSGDHPITGQVMHFTTTTGQLSATDVTTDANGGAQVTVHGQYGQSGEVQAFLDGAERASIALSFRGRCAAPISQSHLQMRKVSGIEVIPIEDCAACAFSDLAKNNPDRPFIREVVALGILPGAASDKQFRPDAEVSRLEFASALQRVLGIDNSGALSETLGMKLDSDAITPREAADAIIRATRGNISKGLPVSVAAKTPLTRAGMAKLLAFVIARTYR